MSPVEEEAEIDHLRLQEISSLKSLKWIILEY
jgi:hypothetical protein